MIKNKGTHDNNNNNKILKIRTKKLFLILKRKPATASDSCPDKKGTKLQDLFIPHISVDIISGSECVHS